jgi:uncharacterized protein YbbK (DUF523 family)
VGEPDDPPLRLGISSCLLGDEVRWDGGHKRHEWLAGVLGPRVEWVRVCPEVEIGLGVPREPIRLERRGDGVRLLATESRRDLTAVMTEWAKSRVRSLGDLDGYVLKSRSPSCGLGPVPVHGGGPGRGLFAAALAAAHPDLPVVEETHLSRDEDRARFLQRAAAYRRVRRGLYGEITPGSAPLP